MPIYKSPSTQIRSADVFVSPVPENISGVPGLVIGTSRRGIPFVPILIKDFNHFVTVYGSIDSQRFGPIALKLWTENSESPGAYMKVLGVGNGKDRVKFGDNAGSVTNAGFVVGSQQVQTGSGTLTHNSHATVGGVPGKTYFLGCFMSESAGSTFLSDAGLQIPGENKARPIIRGVLMAPSGVTLTLNTEKTSNNTAKSLATGQFGSSKDAGLSFGDVLLGAGDQQKFVVILNGFKPNKSYSNVITASFDPGAPVLPSADQALPLRMAFNTDPTKIEEAGHYLHSFFDVPGFMAIPTGSGVTGHIDTNGPSSTPTDGVNAKLYQTAFLLSGTVSHNSGTSSSKNLLGVPNFENFQCEPQRH